MRQGAALTATAGIVFGVLGLGIGVVQLLGGSHLWKSGHPWLGGTIVVLGAGSALSGVGAAVGAVVGARMIEDADAQSDGTTSLEIH